MFQRAAFCKSIFLSMALGAVIAVSPSAAQSIQDDYNMASGYYARGQWAESIESFQSVISRFPNTEQAATSHFFLGEAMMQLSDFAGAYRAYRDFLTTTPHHPFASRATFRLGETAYRLQNYDQAIRLLEVFVLEYPEDPLNEFALPYLGELRIKKNEPQLAQKAYETAMQAFPDSPLRDKCRLGLAKVYQFQESTDRASQLYQSIIAESEPQLAGEARLQMGILSYGQGDYESSRMYLKDTLTTNADVEARVEATYWLARTEVATHRNERAIELFHEAAGQSNNERLEAAILFDGSLAAIQADHSSLATQWLTDLRERWPDGQWADDSLQLNIDILQKETRFDEALALISEFHENHPASPLRSKVFESEGRIYYQQKEYSRSVEIFQTLIDEFSGNQRETWKYLQSLGLIGVERLSEAEIVLESIDLEGQTPKLRSWVELARATTFSRREKHEQSLAAYQNYLALDPDGSESLRVRAELAIAYVRLEQWDHAAEEFIQLWEKQTGQKFVLDTAKYLAETAFSKKENEYASLWFEYLIRPENSKELVACGLSGLAWIKSQDNDLDGAALIFERLFSEHPESPFAVDSAMARAKSHVNSQEYTRASTMYTFVIENSRDLQLRYRAMLGGAYALQKTGNKSDLERAKVLLIEYLESSRDRATMDEAVYQLGWVYHDLGLAAEGNRQFELLVRKYPNSKYWPDAAFRVVQIHVQKKELDAAQSLIQKLLGPATPTEILLRAMFLNGQIAAEKHEWESVTSSMRSLVSESTDDQLKATGNYWLAESLYRQDQFVEAEERFAGIVEAVAELDESLAPWIFLRIAQCNASMEKWTEAKSFAKTAKENYPQFKACYEYDFVMGRAMAAKGKYNNAIVAFQRVVDSPKGGSTETAAIAQWRIGEAYFHQEKFEKAIRAYYQVDSLFGYEKWRAAALMQAGKCQEHLGNWTHAAKLYQQLLTNFPESEFRQAAKERLMFASRHARKEVNAVAPKKR